MSLTTARFAVTHPDVVPLVLGVMSGTTTGPLSFGPPLWMCDAVGVEMFCTVIDSHTWPWFWRSLSVTSPAPSGSPRSGISVTPTMVTAIAVPPADADSTAAGQERGAGTMSAAFARYVFSCFALVATTRWYGLVFDDVASQTGVEANEELVAT